MYNFIIYAEISVNFHSAVIYSIMDLSHRCLHYIIIPSFPKFGYTHVAELVIYERIQNTGSGFVFVYIYI